MIARVAVGRIGAVGAVEGAWRRVQAFLGFVALPLIPMVSFCWDGVSRDNDGNGVGV